MPQTVGQVGVTTVGLVLAILFCYLALKRWGTDDGPDALVVLWRRWGALGHPEPVATRRKGTVAATPARGRLRPRPRDEVKMVDTPSRLRRVDRPPTRKSQPKPKPKRPRTRRVKRDDSGDHLPLAALRPDERDEEGEPKLALRHRFRRGLRRTRDKLGTEVKEAFRAGTTSEAFDRLEESLVAADVGVTTATTLVDELRERSDITAETLPTALREVMVSQLAEPDRRLRLVRDKLTVWVVVGVNGTGKTTTIAKLASRAQALGVQVCLAAGDTFRAAGVEQLAQWAKRLGVDVVQQDTGADPGAVVFDAIAHARAGDTELLIVDTAGRLHTRKPLMDELQKVFRIIERDEGSELAETLLVVDATTGQNGIAQARAFGQAVGVTGLVLAKLDGTAKGGITFAVERELGIPVKAVGVGEKDRDLIPFDPEAFVDAIIGNGKGD